MRNGYEVLPPLLRKTVSIDTILGPGWSTAMRIRLDLDPSHLLNWRLWTAQSLAYAGHEVICRMAGSDRPLPVAVADPGQARHNSLMSLSASFAFSVVCALVVVLFSRDLLALFNPAYPAITGDDLGLLGFGLLGLTPKSHICAPARCARAAGITFRSHRFRLVSSRSRKHGP
jgi:hypothetical protein